MDDADRLRFGLAVLQEDLAVRRPGRVAQPLEFDAGDHIR